MALSGINPENDLVEVIELPKHPYFIGVQYHPELKSTVMAPHPLFVHFVKAALTNFRQKQGVKQLMETEVPETEQSI